MISVFPHAAIASQIVLALGIGLLVGLEREWAHKEIGVRTFALTALLGVLSWLVSPATALAAFAGVLLIVGFVNLRSLFVEQSLEATTSVALIVVLVSGMLLAQGHVFAPVAVAILVTMLLAWKSELSRFAVGLQPEEIRSVVTLGLLGFVIYPILPNRFIDPWQLVNPQEAWITILVIAGLSFASYVSLRLCGPRGLYYTALLGGMVNSTATVAELATTLAARNGQVADAVAVFLLTSVAMFMRNFAILTIFAPRAAVMALGPLAAMALVVVVFTWRQRGREAAPVQELPLTSPVSLRHVLVLGALFLTLQALGTLAERYLGVSGLLGASLIGGLVSSAGATATVALMTARGTIAPDLAGIATVLASMASVLVNVPVVYQQTRRKTLAYRVGTMSVAAITAGLVVLLASVRWSR